MAIRITRIDDIDGTEGAEAITLELDRRAYEIDLGPRNRARLLRVIRPFIERARPLDADDTNTAGEVVGSSGIRRYRREVEDVEGSADADPGSNKPDLFEMAREVRD